jgi:hypothetical protein
VSFWLVFAGTCLVVFVASLLWQRNRPRQDVDRAMAPIRSVNHVLSLALLLAGAILCLVALAVHELLLIGALMVASGALGLTRDRLRKR